MDFSELVAENGLVLIKFQKRVLLAALSKGQIVNSLSARHQFSFRPCSMVRQRMEKIGSIFQQSPFKIDQHTHIPITLSIESSDKWTDRQIIK